MDAIITYDVKADDFFDSKNDDVKDAMKELGYHDHFTTNEKTTNTKKIYYLPNTTLWKKNITPLQAKNDLLIVAKKVNANIQRLFADEFTNNNWEAIEGKPYER